ncbi:hypothetical protein [Pantoea dispersa]|uniref:hypothetical protein n=1 Tax=Pantoea dispersa TaxID=59814 RepID=UPI00123ACAB7|nr:hypothetical protein [Pantoea dispersa]KAA8668722.1 hypothetical protein F4W08_18490 [Pantoea dispersa]
MKKVKLMIVGACFLSSIFVAAVASVNHDGEPSAPYNLRWGMSYDEARNIPLYSLEVQGINYAGMDPNLISAEVEPSELNANEFQHVILYFDKKAGLIGAVFTASVDEQHDNKNKLARVDNGKEGLEIYQKQTKFLEKQYGLAKNKEETVTDKRNFYKSLSECKRKQKEWYNKGLDVSKITNCPKWQSDYEKGRTVVLLTLEPYQITTQYIYK